MHVFLFPSSDFLTIVPLFLSSGDSEDVTSPTTPSSTGGPSSASKSSPTKKPVSSTTKPKVKKESQEDLIDLEDMKIDKWYSGSVPLGLDDDKYWLSELQVYLRANFAEAFGATEEDIAAPMHGRNKPIALGQVGIRCMHCKRKYYYLWWWVSGIIIDCPQLAELILSPCKLLFLLFFQQFDDRRESGRTWTAGYQLSIFD
jgi:hypothetical protein